MHPYNPYIIQYIARNVSLLIQVFKNPNPNPASHSSTHHCDHWINTYMKASVYSQRVFRELS